MSLTPKSIRKICILSDGAWGTALGMHLVRQGYPVVQWGPFPDYLMEMARTRTNPRFLPGVTLPDGLSMEPDLGQAIQNVDLIILASPVPYLRSVLEKLKTYHCPQHIPLLNVAKGIEVDSLKRVSEIVQDYFPHHLYAVLSGPSHAEEVARGKITVVTVASQNEDLAILIQKTFNSPTFRIYTSSDVCGVELGGSLKNVFAIAAGICDGMELGDNAKAALITRSIAEMTRLGIALGGQFPTFSGLSGLGDMIVTCTSRYSRNRYVGEQLGKGRILSEILKEMGMVVAEGVLTTRSAYQLARQHQIDTPIIDKIYSTLYQGENPQKALTQLMARDPKPEFNISYILQPTQ